MTQTIDVPVQFGKGGPNKRSGSIPITVPRESLPEGFDDDKLIESRLRVTLQVDEDYEGEQRNFEGMAPRPVNGIAETNGMSKRRADFGLTLNFLDDVNVHDIVDLSFKPGRMIAEHMGVKSSDSEGGTIDSITITGGGEDQPTMFDDDAPAPSPSRVGAGVSFDEDAWRREPINLLANHGVTATDIRKLVETEPPCDTMGKFGDLGKKHGTYWFRDIDGIGEKAAERIQNAWNAWYMKWEREAKAAAREAEAEAAPDYVDSLAVDADLMDRIIASYSTAEMQRGECREPVLINDRLYICVGFESNRERAVIREVELSNESNVQEDSTLLMCGEDSYVLHGERVSVEVDTAEELAAA